MSCGIPLYHEGRTEIIARVNKRKDYNPPVPTKAFGTPIIWFNKLTIGTKEAGNLKHLYVFETKSGTVKTIGVVPKVGDVIRTLIVPKSKRTTKLFCIVEMEVVSV